MGSPRIIKYNGVGKVSVLISKQFAYARVELPASNTKILKGHANVVEYNDGIVVKISQVQENYDFTPLTTSWSKDNVKSQTPICIVSRDRRDVHVYVFADSIQQIEKMLVYGLNTVSQTIRDTFKVTSSIGIKLDNGIYVSFKASGETTNVTMKVHIVSSNNHVSVGDVVSTVFSRRTPFTFKRIVIREPKSIIQSALLMYEKESFAPLIAFKLRNIVYGIKYDIQMYKPIPFIGIEEAPDKPIIGVNLSSFDALAPLVKEDEIVSMLAFLENLMLETGSILHSALPYGIREVVFDRSGARISVEGGEVYIFHFKSPIPLRLTPAAEAVAVGEITYDVTLQSPYNIIIQLTGNNNSLMYPNQFINIVDYIVKRSIKRPEREPLSYKIESVASNRVSVNLDYGDFVYKYTIHLTDMVDHILTSSEFLLSTGNPSITISHAKASKLARYIAYRLLRYLRVRDAEKIIALMLLKLVDPISKTSSNSVQALSTV